MPTDPPQDAAQPPPDTTRVGTPVLDDGESLEVAAGALIASKYRLVRPAGFGGMGAVWVALNEATNAEVVVKILVADRASSPAAAARFRREAHAAAQLSHRGIVRVFDLIELPVPRGSLAMVMELLRGETLLDALDRKRRFTVEETLDVIVPLLSALAHAHRVGIVHRDLKPENIFLAKDPDGHVTPKILDFGISKNNATKAPRITTDGALLGTPSYMSPEQARGEIAATAASDVFTVGILLYEMLSGASPFSSEAYHSVVAAVLERAPPELENLPPALWAVVARALEKKPEDRYQDASELSAALRAAVGDRSSPADESAPGLERLPVRRRGGVVAMALIVACAVVGALVMLHRARTSEVATSAAAAHAPDEPAHAVSTSTSTSTPIATTIATATPTATATATTTPWATASPSAGSSVPAHPKPKPRSVVRDPGF